MSLAWSLFIFFGFGALSSFIGAITGLGGGFILIPLLTIVGQLDIHDAIFFSLACILWLSVLRMHQNRELIRQNHSIFRQFVGFTLVGSALAAYVGARTPSELLNKLFAILLLTISAYFFWDHRNQRSDSTTNPLNPIWGRLILFCSGFLGGLLGIGGGVINVPTLHKVFRYPMAQATQLSFPFVFISAISALIVSINQRQEVFLNLSPLILLVLLMGTFAVSKLATKTKLSSSRVKVLFAAMIGVIGLIKLLN
jgi:hypothetical protein